MLIPIPASFPLATKSIAIFFFLPNVFSSKDAASSGFPLPNNTVAFGFIPNICNAFLITFSGVLYSFGSILTNSVITLVLNFFF
ncbi:MAG: hypothetical protein GWP19_00425 [Planctomycetia bacterium]|nr:hypothetical protein [Planctomycetia bacterium]